MLGTVDMFPAMTPPAPVPFDPALVDGQRAFLEAIGGSDGKEPLRTDTIEHVRTRFDELMPAIEDVFSDKPVTWEDRTIPGPPGEPDIQVLIVRPTNVDGPLPCGYVIHGGGMVVGHYHSVADDLVELAEMGVIGVSPEYRLAPEHPHPAPTEDCYAGLAWTAEHAAEIGIDPERLFVAGSSAGGGLAAAMALMARDRGGPRLCGQVLLCPMLDDRNETVSSHQYDGFGIWDREANFTGWGALLGDAFRSDDVSPYAAPARATDLSGLPPAFIEVGSAELFRDEDVTYATRIWATGGQAELHVWAGGHHGFAGFSPEIEVSKAANAARLSWLRRILAP